MVYIVKDMKILNKNILKDIPKKSQLEKEVEEIKDLAYEGNKEITDSIGDLYAQNMKLFTSRRQEVKQFLPNSME